MEKNRPTIKQGSISYLILIISLLVLSSLTIFVGQGIGTFINEMVILGIAGGLSLKYKWSWRREYKFKKVKGSIILLSILLGIGSWIFDVQLSFKINGFLNNVFGPLPTGALENMPNGAFQSIMMIVSMIILAPLCEEIFFRGFLQNSFERINYSRSWIYTGILFGIMHMLSGISAGIAIIFVGLIMSYVLYKTRSILPGIIIHATNNFCAVFVTGFAAKSSFLSNWLLWMLIGLVIVYICISIIKRMYKDNRYEYEINSQKVRLRNIVCFFIATIILLGVAGLTIAMRMGVV